VRRADQRRALRERLLTAIRGAARTARPGGAAALPGPRRPRPDPADLRLPADADPASRGPAAHPGRRAYNVAAQLLAVEAGVDRHPPRARVHLSGGRWLTLRADVLDESIAVSIEQCSPAERLDLFCRAFGLSPRETELLGLFCRAFGLSPRETELLGHVVKGNDTGQVAKLMSLSEHTVQDHLKSIFAKSSTRTRKVLISQALGA